jgi:creatinine amidohydrolase
MSPRLETDHRRVLIFDEMTSPDVAAAVAANAPVIIALGAMEQHGAHLPLSTDTYQGLDMCRRASALLAQEGLPLVVGPAIPFGPPPFLSESPKALPGTINISNDTLRILLQDVCLSLIGHGFRRCWPMSRANMRCTSSPRS